MWTQKRGETSSSSYENYLKVPTAKKQLLESEAQASAKPKPTVPVFTSEIRAPLFFICFFLLFFLKESLKKEGE